jgi:DcmR-like sensory protein
MPVLECARCNELYYSAHGSTELSCDACGGNVWRIFEDEVSFARVAGLPRDMQPGDHAALVYTDHAEAAGLCARFLEQGLERGELTLAVIPEALRAEVEHRLGPELSQRVDWRRPADLYREFSPREVAERFAEAARSSDRPLRLLSGPDAEAARAIDVDAWREYERIAHDLTLDLHALVLCIYHARSLPMAFSPVAIETHPLVSRGGDQLSSNPDFDYAPLAS